MNKALYNFGENCIDKEYPDSTTIDFEDGLKSQGQLSLNFKEVSMEDIDRMVSDDPTVGYTFLNNLLVAYAEDTEDADAINAVKRLGLKFEPEEESTGIEIPKEEVNKDPKKGVYDLSGRKISDDTSPANVNSLPKGIYIVDGKKYRIY